MLGDDLIGHCQMKVLGQMLPLCMGLPPDGDSNLNTDAEGGQIEIQRCECPPCWTLAQHTPMRLYQRQSLLPRQSSLF